MRLPCALPSFGLEEPFIWVARQRDTLDQVTLKQEGETLDSSRWPLPYLTPVFWPAWRVWRRACQVRRRFPIGAEPRLLREVRRRALLIAILRSITAAIIVLILWLVVEATYDGMQMGAIKNNLDQPERSMDLLAQDEKHLQDYEVAPWYRHCLYRRVFGQAEVRQLVEESRDRREGILWATVQASPDDLVKEDPARKYLDAYPNGKHVEEANQILQRAADARNGRENEDHFEAVKRAFAEAKAHGFPSADQLRDLDGRIDQVPHPANEGQEQHTARKKLREAIGEARVIAGKKDIRKQYVAFMAEGKVRDAGALLAAHPMPPKDLLGQFSANALERVEKDYRRYVVDKRWRDADDVLSALTADAKVVGLLQAEHLKRLERWRTGLVLAEDRDLYEQLRRYKDLKRAQSYLDDAPLKRMKKEAAAYRDYLLSLKTELPLTLHLSQIDWGNAWTGDTNYAVTLKGQKIMEGKVRAGNNTVSKNVDKADVRYRLTDNVALGIRVIHVGTFKETDYGNPSWEGSVRDLHGRTLVLDGKSPSSKVYFALEGVPGEPALSAYRQE